MMTRPEHNIQIIYGKLTLEGILGLPADPSGVIVFAHGSGSGRLSPRNNLVARYLQQNGLATLLLDLLMPGEAEDRRNVFDIDLLADRLLVAKSWLKEEPRTEKLRIGYFGASTGAGAALQAHSERPLQHPGRCVSRRATGSGRGLPAIGNRAYPADCRRVG